jgi:predicted GH43/DUF377 family glycosyl hydrolase
MTSIHEHEIAYIGGCPPIETKEGWLVIYHGVHDSVDGYVYSACAALLDLVEILQKKLQRLPLFKPDLKYELAGYVNNVVFPTGTALLMVDYIFMEQQISELLPHLLI